MSDDTTTPEAEVRDITDFDDTTTPDPLESTPSYERVPPSQEDDGSVSHPDPIEAARAAGRAEALEMFGGALVGAAFRAAAVGRAVEVDTLLSGLDHRKFLADDGEPDHAKISDYLKRITTPVRPTARRP